MCKILEGGTGGGCSGDARLRDTLNGRTLRGAEFHLLMERGQLKPGDFAQFWLVLLGIKLPFIFLQRHSALCLGPVPLWCRRESSRLPFTSAAPWGSVGFAAACWWCGGTLRLA